MQIVLVLAAFVSLYIGEYHTFLLLIILTVFNALLGYRQEAKAAASVAELNRMMKTVAKVRRYGSIVRAMQGRSFPETLSLLMQVTGSLLTAISFRQHTFRLRNRPLPGRVRRLTKKRRSHRI